MPKLEESRQMHWEGDKEVYAPGRVRGGARARAGGVMATGRRLIWSMVGVRRAGGPGNKKGRWGLASTRSTMLQGAGQQGVRGAGGGS